MKKITLLKSALVAMAFFATTSVFAQNVPTFTEILTPLPNGTGQDGKGELYMQFEAAVAWGDFNNDGYLDLVTTGRTHGGGEKTALYSNNGDGTFTEITGHGLIHLRGNPSLTWLDYDNDGNLDLFITGRSEEAPLNENGQDGKTAKLYKGGGDGTFTEVFTDFFYGVNNNNDRGNRSRYVAVADYDNDGYVDIFYVGDNNGRQGLLYKNNGGIGFTLVATPVNGTDELLKFDQASAAWGDINGDGYLDLLISGHTDATQTTVIYLNNGDGTLAAPFENDGVGMRKGEAALFDFNNDGKLDYAITGWSDADGYITTIYQNDGSMSFTKIPSATNGLPGTESCSLDYGDVNNDGYVDIVMTRSHPNAVFLSNAGDGTFDKISLPDDHNWEYSVASFADYDNDGLLDALTCGEGYGTNLYHNGGGTGIVANTAPTVPTDLDATTDENGVVTFTWTAATDTEGSSLQYNLYVKKSDGTFITFLLPADETTGKLKVNERLAGLVTTTYKINGLADGDEYTLGVSAIDNGKMSSAFATKTFTVDIPTGVSSSVTAKTPKSVQYFDLTGKAVDSTAKGVVIKKTLYEDGSVKNSKEVK